jgi:hypothetical protein
MDDTLNELANSIMAAQMHPQQVIPTVHPYGSTLPFNPSPPAVNNNAAPSPTYSSMMMKQPTNLKNHPPYPYAVSNETRP